MPIWAESFLKASETVRNVAYGLSIPHIIISSLAIGGCTSANAGIPDIFVAKFAGTSLRFGYIGICNNVAGNGNRTVCASTLGSSASFISDNLSTTEDAIRQVISLQNSASLLMPVISWISFGLGILSLICLRRFRWTGLVKSTQLFLWLSVLTSFTGAWAVTYIVAALASVNFRAKFAMEKGPALIALQWTTFALDLMITCLVYVITASPIEEKISTPASKSPPAKSAPPSKSPPPKGPPPKGPPPKGPPPKGPPPGS
ncbi:hypothetical protein BJ875DRAFT_527466 [Amylocarpus encephaloides]|uniref:Uncharacterized protein n=1 Tax=Amylocarpus encephaloides TaxID=45428 RepID=A0A9P7Y679_9HELO|nr:hypothetical protein BJ875DRAFT_527466 [Amylocarpus encephaloides]